MKRVSKVLLGAAGVAAMMVSAASSAGIANTRHNLGTSGTGTNHLTTGTAEICVFCHTPHASDSSAPVPLWNRNLGANANGVKTTYTTYDALGTSTLDGAIAMGSGAVGSVSLACLSCHDGTMAMDSVINAPGSGKVDPAGAEMAGAVWTGTRQDGNGFMKNDGGFASMLGIDLKNDHPVGIQYAGGCADASPYVSGTACGSYKDRDFKSAQSATSVDGRRTWWVDTSGPSLPNARAGTRDVTDMILYSRSLTAGGTVEPFVECASCHDPHVESKDATNQVQFLRVSQAESGVCLACHQK